MARILFLTSSYPDAAEDGVCGYVHDLARHLAEGHGHAVSVLAPEAARAARASYESGPRAHEREFDPVRVERFRHPWPLARRLAANTDMASAVGASPLARAEAGALTVAFAIRAARAAREADVVCSHWLAPAGIVGATVRRPGLPHVAVAHGGDVHLLGRVPWGAQIARSVAARSDRMVFVSDDLARRFERLAPESARRARVIAMGAEIGPPSDSHAVERLRAERGGGRAVALFVGRLAHVKGVDVLLDAAAAEPGLTVWIAGDGPEAARLRARAEASRLHVSFFGRVGRRERRLLLDACDVVAVPSRADAGGREEGAPVVVAEAFAAGRPVVASRTGGLAESVADGRTGLLVAPEDAAALGAALARVAGDAGLARRLGRRALELAGERSAARTAERFDETIGGVLEEARRSGQSAR